LEIDACIMIYFLCRSEIKLIERYIVALLIPDIEFGAANRGVSLRARKPGQKIGYSRNNFIPSDIQKVYPGRCN
jgi:hypothetical protein